MNLQPTWYNGVNKSVWNIGRIYDKLFFISLWSSSVKIVDVACIVGLQKKKNPNKHKSKTCSRKRVIGRLSDPSMFKEYQCLFILVLPTRSQNLPKENAANKNKKQSKERKKSETFQQHLEPIHHSSCLWTATLRRVPKASPPPATRSLARSPTRTEAAAPASETPHGRSALPEPK